jgi:hypothetical protein
MSNQIEESRRRARIALEAYKQAGGIDPDYAIRDLMIDLLHLMAVTAEPATVQYEYNMVWDNYNAEVEENSDE